MRMNWLAAAVGNWMDKGIGRAVIAAVLTAVLASGALAGCGGGQGTDDTGVVGDVAADVLDRDISGGDAADRDLADGTEWDECAPGGDCTAPDAVGNLPPDTCYDCDPGMVDVEPDDAGGDTADSWPVDVPVDVDWTDTPADSWDARDANEPDANGTDTATDTSDANPGDTAQFDTNPGDIPGDTPADVPVDTGADLPGDTGTATTLPDGLAIRIVAGNLSV